MPDNTSATATPGTNPYPVVSYLVMRKAVGWLGMLLPFLLLTGNFLLNQTDIFNSKWFVQLSDNYHYGPYGSFKSSISHYYYTTVGEIFSGVLFAVALFMFSYTGHPLRKGDKGFSDNFMTNLAGVFALGVVLFPTSSGEPIADNMRNYISSKYIGWVHYAFAASFFVVLAFMSMQNFRRAQQQQLFGTGSDDPFYLRCGRVMIACIVLIAIFSFFLEPNFEWAKKSHSTFVFEVIALVAFGLSWLKKGKADLMFLPKLLRRKKN